MFSGDEHSSIYPPSGWETIDLRNFSFLPVSTSDIEGIGANNSDTLKAEMWEKSSRSDQLRMLCPEGYTPIFPKDGSEDFSLEELQEVSTNSYLSSKPFLISALIIVGIIAVLLLLFVYRKL